MGIEVERFIGDSHEPFQCPVCLDVVEDPIVTQCDHIFCKSCFCHGTCPSCRENVGKVKPMNRLLQLIYSSLKLKCLQPDCKEVLTIENYKSHDENCGAKMVECLFCGCEMKSVHGHVYSDHDCIQHLKDKIMCLELELADRNAKRVKCAIQFMVGATAYHCKTCSSNPWVALCHHCFVRGGHDGHKYEKKPITSFGGYCDCGDGTCLKYNVHCDLHKPN